MGTDDAAAVGPARSMALLWRATGTAQQRPGPRPSLDVDRIVAAALRLADAEGLAALSMRRIAAELGVATMTIYGHVPGKTELVDLVLDAALGELHPDEEVLTTGPWRARLRAVASANRDFYEQHPWAGRSAMGGLPLGPGRMRKYELELRAVDGLGLAEEQMDLLVGLVDGFVRGTVGGVQVGADAERATGTSEDRWWAAARPHLARVVDPDRFPTAARVAAAAGGRLGTGDTARSFEFGLERLLDGIGVLLLEASR